MNAPIYPEQLQSELPFRPAERKLLLGLIGSGIQLSLTPAMQEAEAAHHGIRTHYQLIDLDFLPGGTAWLERIVSSAKAIGFNGFNVTYPCKQLIIPSLHSLSPEAEKIGAVNTVVLQDGNWIGYNTDASGWRRGFETALPGAELGAVLLLGAGGAGAAIAHALAAMGVQSLEIFDRDAIRATQLAAELNRVYARVFAKALDPLSADELSNAAKRVHGIVHATPTGMAKHPGLPIDPALLLPHHWVSEAVYSPIETELVRLARQRGCAVMHGGLMAVGQAVDAFELFTGVAADVGRVTRHFDQLLLARGQ